MSKIYEEMLNNKLEKTVVPVFSNKRMSVDLLLRTEFESFLSYNWRENLDSWTSVLCSGLTAVTSQLQILAGTC